MNTEDNHYEILITKYLSGEASAAENETLAHWLKAHPDHLQRFNQLKNLWDTGTPAFQPDAIDEDAALAQVMKQVSEKASVRFWLYAQRVAAILFLPLLATCIFFYTKQNDQTYTTLQKVIAPYGSRTELTLPDSTHVYLNAGSTLSYPVTFKQSAREVTLNGEAYFEVKASAQQPFTVKTKQLQVKALGTAFHVNAYEHDSIMAVTLVSGKVHVLLPHAEQVPLTVGTHLQYSASKNSYTLDRENSYKWYAWKDNKLLFRDDSLAYVFKTLNQFYHARIVVKDSSLNSYRYRASFEGETLDEILHALQLSMPIRYQIKQNRKVIEVYHTTH